MSMFIWEVTLEVEWKRTWTEGKKTKSEVWIDVDVNYTVAAQSGREAIIKAEKLAMAQESWTGEHYCDDNSVIPTKETPHRVLDIVGLELKDTLDG